MDISFEELENNFLRLKIDKSETKFIEETDNEMIIEKTISSETRNRYDYFVHNDAFDFSVTNIAALWEHYDQDIVGKILKIFKDGKLIKARFSINKNLLSPKQLYALKNLNMGTSIGFIITEYKYDESRNLHVLKLDLIEASFTICPANPDTLLSFTAIDKPLNELNLSIINLNKQINELAKEL